MKFRNQAGGSDARLSADEGQLAICDRGEMCVRFYRLRGYALLIQSSIKVLREKDSDCLYNIQKQVQETKHHYPNQRRLSGKGKPFTELVHSAMPDAFFEIGNMRCKGSIKSRHY